MISVEDYSRLIEEIYESDDEQIIEKLPIEDYIPKYIPDKKSLLNLHKTINATNLKKQEIKNIITQSKCIIIGNFVIYAKACSENKLNYIIYEKVNKTLSGFPCNMEVKISLNDKRFANNKLFNSIYDISIDKCIEIIRYLQGITKYIAFM